MSLEEKLIEIAENEPKVYESGYNTGHNEGYTDGYDKGLEDGEETGYTRGYAEGKTSGYGEGYDVGYETGYEIGNTNGENVGYAKSTEDFWNGIQDFGNRTDYQYGFNRWGNEYIKPKYKVVPTGNCTYLFGYCSNLKRIDKDDFDLSQANYSISGNTSATYRTFVNDSSLEEIPDIGLQAGYCERTYQNCSKLKIIHKLRSTKDCKWTNAFQNDYDLEDILEIEGEIGQDGFNVSASTKLTRATLLRILNALYDYSSEGGKHTITLGVENQEKVAEEIESIANARGWTVA